MYSGKVRQYLPFTERASAKSSTALKTMSNLCAAINVLKLDKNTMY